MEVTILLCDYAESINGKLYITGGGWTQFRGAEPVNCSVAVSMSVPWTQANQRHSLSLELLQEDGQIVLDPDGQPMRVDGNFEVGRPPGSVPGDALTNTMAFGFQGLDLPSGGYKFSFSIDGTEMGAARFRVTRPQEGK